MFEGNVLLGVVILSMQLSNIDDKFAFFKLGKNSFNVLISSTGEILNFPLPNYTGIPTDLGLFDPYLNEPDIIFYPTIEGFQKKTEFLYLDSIGTFKCPNSLAISYHLANNFRLLNVHTKGLLPYTFSSLFLKIFPFAIIILILFFIFLMIIINKTLASFNQITETIARFDKYDPYN